MRGRLTEHAVRINEEKCIGCVTCMKSCPTRAIRIVDRTARIKDERCIDCGECLRVCPREAVEPITSTSADLDRFRFKVALPSPVLYSQFGPGYNPGDILHALGEMGYDSVFDEAIMCEMTSLAIEAYLEEQCQTKPLISSTCPVVVRLIKRLFPALCDLIIPIEPPREVEAGRLRHIDYLECLICPDGCVGGPLTVENRFVAKSNILNLIRKFGGRRSVDERAARKMYREGFFSFEHNVKPKPFPPLDPDRSRALDKMKVKLKTLEKLPGTDCGLCGSPDCETFAEDVAREGAALESCIFFRLEKGDGCRIEIK